jgi:hypothetical protein
LARVVDAWPSLPEHIRAAILALVTTVGSLAGPTSQSDARPVGTST